VLFFDITANCLSKVKILVTRKQKFKNFIEEDHELL